MNELLFFVTVIIYFGGAVLIERIFKKEGLYAYIALTVILANIETLKIAPMFGFDDNVVLGTVAFATVFLCTDILTVKYGAKEARKGVYLALISSVFFLCVIQIDLLFTSSESGAWSDDAMHALFGLDGVYVWVNIASVLMFFLSNLADVYLFDKLFNKTKTKKMWLANNVATITTNCLENFLFVFLGYYLLQKIFMGETLYSFTQCMIIAGTTSLFEIVLAILDTPFLYLAKYQKKDKLNGKRKRRGEEKTTIT